MRVREALFDALSQLMGERGFDAVSMSDIAAHAGIGRTAVYNYFSDKESLLLGFVARETELFSSTLENALDRTPDPIDKLRVYVHSQLMAERSYLSAPGPPLRSVVSRDTGAQIRKHAMELRSTLNVILSDAIARHVIPEQDIAVVSQLISGLLTGRRVPKEEPARSHFFTVTEQLVLRAVGADTSGITHEHPPLEIEASGAYLPVQSCLAFEVDNLPAEMPPTVSAVAF